jgi:hypothetical protein
MAREAREGQPAGEGENGEASGHGRIFQVDSELQVAKSQSEFWKRQHDRIAAIVQGWADSAFDARKQNQALCHENNKLRASNEQLRHLPENRDKPWPTRDAIERLCQFAEGQLANDYDGHGWEELREAASVVRTALSKSPPPS